jgi:hypothetical protein
MSSERTAFLDGLFAHGAYVLPCYLVTIRYISFERSSLFRFSVFEPVASDLSFPWDFLAGYTKWDNMGSSKVTQSGDIRVGKESCLFFAYRISFAWYCYILHLFLVAAVRPRGQCRLANLVQDSGVRILYSICRLHFLFRLLRAEDGKRRLDVRGLDLEDFESWVSRMRMNHIPIDLYDANLLQRKRGKEMFLFCV